MADSYRLTFNKPAVAQLLHTDSGEAADGLRVRIENGVAQFMPVNGSNDDDVLHLETRSRGGAEADIEGSMADELFAALSHDDGPFHSMKRGPGGWLVTAPTTNPSKFVPHLRMWNKTADKPLRKKRFSKEISAAATITAKGPVDIRQMFEALREAKATVNDFAQAPRRGQPPKVVREAREVMAAFGDMVVEMVPEVVEAHSILNRLVTNHHAPA